MIETTKNPHYMLQLGGFYYEKKDFDHALKYYELAAEYKLEAAYDCLGYIWYYGRTGTKDYEKAFKYFSLSKDAGNIQAAYKIADMYKNGYYVEKDYEKYKKIIEELYPKVAKARNVFDPLPEVFTRLAHIRSEDGRTEDAISLYLYAKDFLAERIRCSDFFGDFSIMSWLIDDLYKLKNFDTNNFDFYDMYYLLTAPCEITFSRGSKKYKINVVKEDEGVSVEFCGKYFRSREDFFKKASLGAQKLAAIYDELYDFRGIK